MKALLNAFSQMVSIISMNVNKTKLLATKGFTIVHCRLWNMVHGSDLNWNRCITCTLVACRVGTLNNYDDDGSENITEKMNLPPFKLYRVYLELLNSSNLGLLFLELILKGFIHVQIEKGKFVVVCPRPLQNVALEGFTS